MRRPGCSLLYFHYKRRVKTDEAIVRVLGFWWFKSEIRESLIISPSSAGCCKHSLAVNAGGTRELRKETNSSYNDAFVIRPNCLLQVLHTYELNVHRLESLENL